MNSTRRGVYSIDLIWEVPLALVSFLCFQCVRWLLWQLADHYVRLHPDHALQWQPYSREFVNKPGALPILMTTAPRWNPHAVIGTVGPFQVKQTIHVDTAAARTSAELWTIVLYSYPKRKTVGLLSSLNASGAGWELFTAIPGRYGLGLRYYRWKERVQFPAIRVDGVDCIAQKEVPADINGFYDDLIKRQSFLYYTLHYYVYTMLRCRSLLPKAFVERQYLPVGNPETRFYYGAIEAGERLQFRVDPSLFQAYDVYLTICSRQSFPVVWRQIGNSEESISPVKGYYLIRIHPNSARNDEGQSDIERQFTFCTRRAGDI